MFDAYRQALRAPGAKAFYLAAAPARVGIAMTVLGMVWLVHGATGSYAQAGLATGAFALTEAVIGPQSARAIDAFGQTRVVPLLLAAHAVCVAGLIAGGPAILLAGLAGATIPQVGALAARRRCARSAARPPPPVRSEDRSAALGGPVVSSLPRGRRAASGASSPPTSRSAACSARCRCRSPRSRSSATRPRSPGRCTRSRAPPACCPASSTAAAPARCGCARRSSPRARLRAAAARRHARTARVRADRPRPGDRADPDAVVGHHPVARRSRCSRRPSRG